MKTLATSVDKLMDAALVSVITRLANIGQDKWLNPTTKTLVSLAVPQEAMDLFKDINDKYTQLTGKESLISVADWETLVYSSLVYHGLHHLNNALIESAPKPSKPKETIQ